MKYNLCIVSILKTSKLVPVYCQTISAFYDRDKIKKSLVKIQKKKKKSLIKPLWDGTLSYKEHLKVYAKATVHSGLVGNNKYKSNFIHSADISQYYTKTKSIYTLTQVESNKIELGTELSRGALTWYIGGHRFIFSTLK